MLRNQQCNFCVKKLFQALCIGLLLSAELIVFTACQTQDNVSIAVPSSSLVDEDQASAGGNPADVVHRVESVNIGGTRHYARSIVHGVPYSFEWQVDVPEQDPFLEFTLGYRFVEGSRPGYTRCSVSVRSDEEEESVFSISFWANNDFQNQESFYRTVSLADYSGRNVTLVFTAETVSESLGTLEIAWANPTIYERRRRTKPNVVLICIDTLRADHFQPLTSSYLKTPNLSKLAADSVVFEKAIAPSSWTLPTVSSVMTGLLPSFHTAGERVVIGENLTPQEIANIRAEHGFTYTFKNQVYGYNQLRDDIVTIPEIIKDEYRCHMVNSNAFLSDASDLASRFTSYHDYIYPAYPGFMVTFNATEWLERNYDKLFFLYVHYMDVHEWLNRAAEQLPRKLDDPVFRQRARATYDEMVELEDQYVGIVIDKLKQTGVYDDSFVIFYSDHGEHLWEPPEEDRYGHGNSLSNILLHVPLMIKFPNSAHAGERVSDYVGLIDIFQTVLDATGHVIERPLEKQSLSLLDIVESGRSPQGREFISEFTVLGPELEGIQIGEHRLIYNKNRDHYVLVDAATDNRINIRRGTGKELYDRLLTALEAYRTVVEKVAAKPNLMKLERRLFKRFRDLGYIN